ncbi:putative necrosis-inducing factor-domain-containing protein [Xylariales sp. AK1849]|nr:putative necrosis-inducing factor-domain-containing protein [Xylariales sp. AK1849]
MQLTNILLTSATLGTALSAALPVVRDDSSLIAPVPVNGAAAHPHKSNERSDSLVAPVPINGAAALPHKNSERSDSLVAPVPANGAAAHPNHNGKRVDSLVAPVPVNGAAAHPHPNQKRAEDFMAPAHPPPKQDQKRDALDWMLSDDNDRCGATTWEDHTASTHNAPSISDCLQIADHFSHQTGYFSLEVIQSSSTQLNVLGSIGSCKFGAAPASGRVDPRIQDLYIGSQDVVDIIHDAVSKFAKEDKVAATGTTTCTWDGDLGHLGGPMMWSLYHS